LLGLEKHMLKGDIMLIYHTWLKRNLETITRLKEHASVGDYDARKERRPEVGN
jgi:hypothetical protein